MLIIATLGKEQIQEIIPLYGTMSCVDIAKIYNVKKEKFLKELVIENNVPKLINYQIEHKYSLSDEGKGIKGYLNAKTKDSEHEILVI